MKFLGIDPGYARLGYGIIEVRAQQPRYVDAGVFETAAHEKEGRRLWLLLEFLERLFRKHKITHAALEQVFLRRDLSTGIRLAEARGIIVLSLYRAQIPYSEISPSAMKKAITGSGSAHKKAVQLMTAKLLQVPTGVRLDDADDGLGLAFCAWLNWQKGVKENLGRQTLPAAR